MQTGKRTYWKNNKFMRYHNISGKTKLRIYRPAIQPMITYAEEDGQRRGKDVEVLKCNSEETRGTEEING